ncbi:MAG: 3-phosphoglycerate dehydrogenase [Clostridia bacterium]|nr:3-phosphoglycerate dehydrogenase [Clostridia bacterium]
MKQIKMLNKIAKVGTDLFDKDEFRVATDVESPDAILVRSGIMHDMKFEPNMLAIARAGAGVNNIPVDRCAREGIVVFNTPGANANGVKELAIAALMLASRDIVGGIRWASILKGEENVAKAVEGGKSKFAGCEIMGKTLGVIGLGAIGGLVANTARSLGMDVIGCDPYLTVDAAWSLSRSVKHADSYDEIYKKSDFITLHVPATKTTAGMINKETIAKMKNGVRIINLSRADLVNAEDMKAALKSGKVKAYVTDFPTEATLDVPGIVNIPHLGASTEESEDNCAVMAAKQLIDFIKTGNIRNSVNYPSVAIPRLDFPRVCIMHTNAPGMLSKITDVISGVGINIENLANGSKGDFAYTIVELAALPDDKIVAALRSIAGVVRVRTISVE